MATSTARADQQPLELIGCPDAHLHLQVVGAGGEQLDHPRGGDLAEERRHGDPQDPLAVGGRPDLVHGQVLETEHLDGPRRQPQPAGREAQATGAASEQLVAEFLAQRGHVSGHRRLRHIELSRGGLRAAEPGNRSKRSELGGRHEAPRLRPPAVTQAT